jgi:hypothetical protein
MRLQQKVMLKKRRKKTNLLILKLKTAALCRRFCFRISAWQTHPYVALLAWVTRAQNMKETDTTLASGW